MHCIVRGDPQAWKHAQNRIQLSMRNCTKALLNFVVMTLLELGVRHRIVNNEKVHTMQRNIPVVSTTICRIPQTDRL